MMMFEPLNSDGRKRSAVYHAARLSMLHHRVVKRMDKVDNMAEEVERAVTSLVEAAHADIGLDPGKRSGI